MMYERACAARRKALANPASQPAIKFAKLWTNWGDLRQLAERVAALLVAHGTAPGAKTAIVARNHPSASGAFIGLIAKNHSVRMVYSLHSTAAVAQKNGRRCHQ